MKSVVPLVAQLILIVNLVCSGAASGLTRPECRSTDNCRFHSPSLNPNNYVYNINGLDQILRIIYDPKDEMFEMFCNNKPSNVVLAADDPAMPVMPKRIVVKIVIIRNCIVPKSSYRAALAAMNVTLDHKDCTLELTELHAFPQLEGYHLEEFGPQIKELLLTSDNKVVTPKFDFLAKLTMLEKLELKLKIKPEIELTSHLPTSLKDLTLLNTGLLLQNDNSWLGRLKALELLYVDEFEHDGMPFERSVTLAPLADLPNLRNVILKYLPLGPLSDSTMWLRNSSLEVLNIEKCGLKELPDKLFEGANISKILLPDNLLENLNGAFAPLHSSLLELDLSVNLVKGEDLIAALSPLKSLETLIATTNPLGSLCGNGIVQGHLKSHLPTSLRSLELENTGVKVICDDWIESQSLDNINLTNNGITHLRYSDLKMLRGGGKPVRLNLNNNKLRIENITQSDFEECLTAKSHEDSENYYKRVPVQLMLDSFKCDCNAYWFREMLNNCSLLQATDVTCETASNKNIALLEHDPQLLTCPYDGPDCPEECSKCEKRKSDNATVVWCQAAERLPERWPPTSPSYPLALHLGPNILDRIPRGLDLVELHAPYNNITQLDEADIPITLRVLDVRNNRIGHITSAAAKTLRSLSETSKPWNVSLAGNLLDCACDDEFAISILKDAKITDWNAMQCTDLELVKDKTKLCTDATLATLLGVTGLLLLLTFAALILLCLRPRIKQFLFDHNWCLQYVLNVKDDVNDRTKSHNVFLSYSHLDEAQALELARELERNGHRVIIHTLHFEPGKSILQNVVDSVLSARRTLLLVSDNFARSDWGLEEFRTAHAHALERGSSRVIVVRYNLSDLNKLPQDLQFYLCHNTYLDWNDPYFLKKLLRVMPPPQDNPQPEIAHIQDKTLDPAFQIRLVPQANVDSGLSLSHVSLNNDIPLSELVLVPPVQQNKHGPLEQSRTSPVTPVVREPPQLNHYESPLSTEIKRGPLSAMRTPAVVYV